MTDDGAAAVPPIGVSHLAIGVTDMDRALEFWRDVLALRVDLDTTEEVPSPDGTLRRRRAVYLRSGADDPESDHAPFVVFASQEAKGRGGRFNFTVDDPDEIWERLRGPIEVIEPLFDTASGTRKFTIADLDGNELGFVDHVA